MKTNYDVIIIGGGASGMMAAVTAGRLGKSVLVVEKNDELGKKLKITGGGRCNILNAEYDQKLLLQNYGEADKYLHSLFSKFTMTDTVEFFKSIGVNIKIEDRKRAFPTTERAPDVYNALKKEMDKYKVEVLLNSKVTHIHNDTQLDGNKNTITSIEVNSKEEYTADKYILSTGGKSHPETGSTGDGFIFLKRLGLSVLDPTPTLVPLYVKSNWINKSSGKTIKNVKMTFFIDGVKVKSKNKIKNGVLSNKTSDTDKNVNILCTHTGVSGPSIINVSQYVQEWLDEGEVTASIDLYKNMNEKELDDHIINIFDNNKNKKLKNVLDQIHTDGVLEEIFLDRENNLSDIDLEKEVNSITKIERKKIVQALKNIRIKVGGLMEYDKAIVANGGLVLDEVDFKNMSLKKIHNLYVTGDILNIHRPSGGYSLQLCWTSGYVAGVGK
jgi:predicted Rossmann fold flavoprotein